MVFLRLRLMLSKSVFISFFKVREVLLKCCWFVDETCGQLITGDEDVQVFTKIG